MRTWVPTSKAHMKKVSFSTGLCGHLQSTALRLMVIFSFSSPFISVCDVEIEYGVLQAENPKRSCVWFHRMISGLDSPDHAKNPTVLKYRDYCLDELCDRNDAHPHALLHKLKNKKMKEVMHIENIFTYDTPWTPKGKI